MTDKRVLCSKCRSDNVLVYMTVASAICPNCCDDHDYRYEGRADGHMCIHCGDSPPDDWYANDDDCGFSVDQASSEVIGTPASVMCGNASQRHADPQAWDNWLAFCERNGLS